MSGTIDGGKKAAIKNKARHGSDFYKRIGTKGGQASGTGGFYNNKELARKAGLKGGLATLESRHTLRDQFLQNS